MSDTHHFHTNGANSNLNGSASKKKSDNDEVEIDLKELVYTLLHYKWTIIGVTLTMGAIAVLIAFLMTPIYQSEGSLLISQQQNQLGMSGENDLGSLMSSAYGIGMGSTVTTELQVMRSRKLSELMADKLMKNPLAENGQMYPVLWRGWQEDSTVTSQDTVAKRIRDNIAFSQLDQEGDMVRLSYESPSPLEAAQMINLALDTYSEISTDQKRLSANSAVDFLKDEREEIEERLRANEEELRKFMNNHRLVRVDAQTEELIKRMAELESRRQEAKVKLVAVNSAVEQYKERLNNIKPGLAGQYAQAIGPQMSRLQYQLAELETEKMLINANNPNIQSGENTPPELLQINKKIGLVKKRIEELTGELINQGDQYVGFLGGGEGNVAQTITEINQKLIELSVKQKQYQAQTDVIGEQLDKHEQFFDDLPDNMIHLARLKRDVTINEELFLAVSKQYAQMELWEQTQFGKGRPVDYGNIPKEPVKPVKPLFLLVGLVLGGVFSLGYVLVKEAFKTSLDSVEKMKKRNYPLLGVIPNQEDIVKEKFEGEDEIIVNGQALSTGLLTVLDTISPFAEAFRRLATNLRYSRPDHKLKVLAVTSSKKGEGKTSVSGNLAAALAESGKQILLVDLDFRRPNLHNIFGIKQRPGLSNVLFDETDLSDAIKPSVIEGVDVMTTGTEPPNPAALSQSRKLKDLLRKFKEDYDVVLVDTAPYGIITDAGPLFKEMDGIIVVARFEETDETELDHTLEDLKQINADILGTVLTAYDPKQSGDYRYSGGYYRNKYQNYKAYKRD